MTIDFVQIPMAIVASWRLTELIVADTIALRLRTLIGSPASCVRCVSVWSGIACTATLLWAPWLNWPLAMSWLYMFLASRQNQANLQQAYEQARQQAMTLFQENQALKDQIKNGHHTRT